MKQWSGPEFMANFSGILDDMSADALVRLFPPLAGAPTDDQVASILRGREVMRQKVIKVLREECRYEIPDDFGAPANENSAGGLGVRSQ